MRRGCISLGEITCISCGQPVPHSERYLALEEENGAEVEEGGTTVQYCMACAVEKGYAFYEDGKDEKILTVFPKPEF